jgi:perosamine synthetase
MNKLAILGGPKEITKNFKPYNSIGVEEVKAASNVIETGILSDYLGAWSPKFYGGKKVLEFEKKCQNFFKVKHAISVNSWTSGLTAAVGAVGISPGDEVIVTPWTMCATATSILHWNAIPVFADIDPITFNIDPESVKKNITENTKAIMAVDIFGHPCDVDSLIKIAKKNNLKLITDTAQAPGSYYKNKHTGTISDVGGFSLNYHKHFHTGEGGIVVTNCDEIAKRVKLIRNHAEAVVDGMGETNISNMIGHNYRMGEVECAMAIEQLKKLPSLVKKRQSTAEKLTELISNLKGLRCPSVSKNCTHSYYIYGLVIDLNLLNVTREKLVNALTAEGVPGLTNGYANIHLLPMYQKKIAYGNNGFPWNSDICKRDVNYSKGICPVAEELHESSFISFLICLYDLDDENINEIANAFKKVWSSLDSIR